MPNTFLVFLVLYVLQKLNSDVVVSFLIWHFLIAKKIFASSGYSTSNVALYIIRKKCITIVNLNHKKSFDKFHVNTMEKKLEVCHLENREQYTSTNGLESKTIE